MRDFFYDRAIPDEYIDSNGISFFAERWNFIERKVGPAIGFPFFKNGELINIKYRGTKKAFSLEKDCELIFWNLNSIVQEGRVASVVVITEGEMDAIACQVAGFKAVISVPNGAPSTTTKDFARHFDFIRNSNYKLDGHEEGILDEVTEFIIAVDSDGPGLKLEEELIRRFGPERCRRTRWPAGCKDANDVLMQYSSGELRRQIEKAEAPPVAGIFREADIHADLDLLYDNGLQPGLSIGFKALTKRESLKELYTIAPGMLTGVLGVPNMGKSTFIEQVTVNLAREYGWRFAMFTPETAPVEYAVSQIVEKFVRKPFTKGPTERLSKEELEYAAEWVGEHYYWIMPTEEDFGIDTVLKKTQVLIQRYGVNGLVIDPWNNLEVFLPHGMTETTYLKQCIRKLKIFALDRKIHVWIAIHPSKLLLNPKTKKYDIPRPYDCMGGSYWYNMLDFILAYHREKPSDLGEPAEVHVQKVKRRHLGELGFGRVGFNVVTGNFFDLDNVYANEKSVRTGWGYDAD